MDNIPRVLPKICDVVIRKGSWDMLPIFKMIEAKSGVPDGELYQVFNMGIGMVAIVSAEKQSDFEIHPRPKTRRLAHRRNRERKGRGKSDLSFGCGHIS